MKDENDKLKFELEMKLFSMPSFCTYKNGDFYTDGENKCGGICNVNFTELKRIIKIAIENGISLRIPNLQDEMLKEINKL